MRLITLTALAAALCVSACGPGVGPSAGSGTGTDTGPEPESWMGGWFSSLSPDATISEDYAQYFEIRDDGTVLITFQGGCGGAESVEFAKLWEPQDEDALLVFAVPGAEPDAHDDDSWVIRRLECGQYEVQRQHGGTHMRPAPIFAGRLCMEPGPNMEDCVGSGCNRCYKSWCDGEGPPSCGGE